MHQILSKFLKFEAQTLTSPGWLRKSFVPIKQRTILRDGLSVHSNEKRVKILLKLIY